MSDHRFTTRGRVALAFSCLSGILGVIVVAWYGLVPEPGALSGAKSQGGGGETTPGAGSGGTREAATAGADDAAKPALVTSISGGGSTIAS